MFKLKSKQETRKNINKPEYHVIVKKYMAKNIPQIIAEFDAIQDKTGDNNLVIKNISFDFKEEINLKEDDIISDLKYRLNLLKETKQEQIRLVEKKIKQQEERINKIDKGQIKKLNKDGKPILDDDGKPIFENVNIFDEKEKLTNYKVLLYCIKNDGDGSYIEINQQGLKQISYLYEDGILKPIFHVSKDNRINLYPNEGANRKRYNSEQYLIDKEFQEDTNGLLGSKLDKLLKLAVIIILALEVFAGFQLIGAYKNYHKQIDSSFMAQMEDKAEGSAIKCAYWYSEVMKSNFNVINYYNKKIMNMTEEEKKKRGIEDNKITEWSNKLLAIGKN